MGILKINAAGLTDVGTSKVVNEDSFVYKIVDAGNTYAGIFAVADGVGGLEAGEMASAISISNINKWWNEEFKMYFNNADSLIQSLKICFQKTNEDILQYSKINNIKLATTLSVLLIHKHMYYILHIGDSRIYKINSRIELLSEDHSCIIDRTVNGRTYKKSVLTECLGYKKDINYYFISGDISKNDIFIICSDGVYKTISDDEIIKYIKKSKSNLETSCEELINEAKRRGERDNITLIVTKIIK